ncbi:MAG: sensor histidine kinase [Anaerolineae bacterium]
MPTEDPQEEIATLKAALAHAEEALEAKEAARQAFVSLVAHELRVPMTSIKGYTDLLLKGIVGPVNKAQSDFLTTIRTNVERMAKLLTNLSDINKIDGERLKLAFEPVPVANAIKEVFAALDPIAQEKAQTVTVRVSDALPPLWADRERFVQILRSVLENAVQYTPRGGTITIEAQPVPKKPGQVLISVQDTGIGIPEEEQARIFEMFFRASDEQTREIPGHGLSLHLSKRLAELQGGTIWFESERGSGSTFYLRLPIAASQLAA